MSSLLAIDRRIGAAWPDLSTPAAVAAVESVPLHERLAAHNTYDALRLGAGIDRDAPAILFLPNADPDEPAITISYADLMARITQSANVLHRLGVGPTDVVSMLLPLLPQSFYALFGAQATGIVNPVNPLLEPNQLIEILRAANTKVLITLGPTDGSDIWPKVQAIRRQLPGLAAIVAVHAPRENDPLVYDFDALLAAAPTDQLISGRRIAPDDVAAYFHTGGTTGTPKLVRHTHLNQVYQAWVIGVMLHSQPGTRLLFGLPLFHVGGALTQGLASLAGGAAIVVLSPSGWRNGAALRNVWRLIDRYRPQTFGGVPTVLAAALAIPRDGCDLSSLTRVSGGGSAIPVAVASTYSSQMNLPVLEVYGMTETASVHTISYADRPIRLGSVGHPVPYSRVRVVKLDPDGRYLSDCAVNEIGVVAMAGPGVFSGYLSAAHNRGAFVEPGWVNSGDLGRIDADGYLWITGRAKDLVIRGGHNIDPMAIEEVFYQHPSVGLAAVVGQPDAYAGELPVAYVQAKPGVKVDVDQLLDFVRQRTPERAAVPVALYLIDPMPLTAVGKVFKPALRLDAAKRAVARLLADLTLAPPRLHIDVSADAVHGTLITVSIDGIAPAQRAAVIESIDQRLDPLTIRHRVIWTANSGSKKP